MKVRAPISSPTPRRWFGSSAWRPTSRHGTEAKEIDMANPPPPFRADQVGSLLRSGPVKEARGKREAGQISAEELKAVEDAEIKKIIKKQEEIGLRGITDGEFRRSWWHYDFLAKLNGVELVHIDHGIQFAGMQTKAEAPRVFGKIDFPKSHP